jgi:nucleotide-binding universal stress UspA family protein
MAALLLSLWIMRTPRRILVPIDYSEASLRGLRYALSVAGLLGASVTVLHVFGEVLATPYMANKAEEQARREIDEIVRAHRAPGIDLNGMVAWAAPADGIHRVAEEIDADLLVLGTHARTGVTRALIGSVCESVLRDSTRPIVAIPPARGEAVPVGLPKRILVATDLSKTSEPAVDYAVDLAVLVGASVVVLHSYALPRVLDAREIGAPIAAAAQAALDRALSAAKDRGATIETALREGDPVVAITETARQMNADLLVLGTRGRHGLERMFVGSVAETVIRTATRPVLTLHAPG